MEDANVVADRCNRRRGGGGAGINGGSNLRGGEDIASCINEFGSEGMNPIGQGRCGVDPGTVIERCIREPGGAVVDLNAGDSIGIGIGASQPQDVAFG